MRSAVEYKSDFNQFQGKSLDLDKLKSLFPENASFRCATHNGKQYLYEVFFLIDRQGQPYTEDKTLQIGGRCLEREIHIPVASSLAFRPD